MLDAVQKHTGRYVFGIFLVWILCSTSVSGFQVSPQRQDTSKSTVPTDPVIPEKKTSNIKDAVQFQSNDSLIVNFRNGRTATLYGAAKVSHEAGTLTSGAVEMDLNTSTLKATSETPEDTLSLPVLTRDSEEIRSNRILFNYKTKKGKFEAARINVGEGHLIGSKVKNVNESEVFIEDGIYSTCPPDYLYYYIKAKKMKVVDQDEIFFANARIYILDIPYPIVFPFGYVPTDIKKQRSGLLTPTYVFDAKSTRGIGLNNVGWFQYFNDYITSQASVDIYTSGSFYLDTRTQYRKTDKFSGSIGIGYSREQGLEPTDIDFSRRVNKSLTIQHNQDISPYANLSANVNIRTADYYQRNSFDINDKAQTSSTSRIGYNYNQPEGVFKFGTTTQLTQNFFKNSTTLGPEATFSTKRFSPFQNSGPSNSSPRWYESITMNYTNSLKSRFDYSPVDADSAEITFYEALTNPDLYREASDDNDYIQGAMKQTATATVGRLLNSTFINSSLSGSYNEYWYPTSTLKYFNADSNRVETEKEIGFRSARDFSTNLSFSTTVYGISNTKIGNLQGFRHTLTPSIGLTYRPDFSDEKWGYYKTYQTDSTGRTQKYSIFENEIISGPGRGEQRSISFGLRNVFETKIVKRDTTGETSERNLKLIDNLSLSSSYNFAADSLKLAPLNTSLSSQVIKGIRLSASANFSFYQRDSLGRQFDRFLIEDGGKMAQLENFRLSATTSFRGGKSVSVFTPVYRRQYDPYNQSRFNPIDPRFGLVPIDPLNSPWSFSLNFSYSWRYNFDDSPTRSATLNATNITFNLTPKWRFSTQIGYDFIQKELTPSQFNLTRNLECWDLSFQIKPFGEDQYYFFRLSVNSAQIQTLFQKLPILKNLERRSTPTGKGYN